MRLVRPEKRTIEREVEQPGFIEAYEQTSLYAKLAGYVRKWNVDIGDPIEENQILAEIAIPELEAEYREKKAQTALDVVMVQVAEELVSVADHNWKVAKAQTQEARAKIDKVLADVERWQSEVKRLSSVTDVIDRQVLEESKKQLKSYLAGQEMAQAGVRAAEATELAPRPTGARPRWT